MTKTLWLNITLFLTPQVKFRLEFEFSNSVLLDHVKIMLEVTRYDMLCLRCCKCLHIKKCVYNAIKNIDETEKLWIWFIILNLMIKKHYYKIQKKIQKKIPFQTNDLLKFSKIFGAHFCPVEHKTTTTINYTLITGWLTHWNLLDVVSVKVSRTLLMVWNVMTLWGKGSWTPMMPELEC